MTSPEQPRRTRVAIDFAPKDIRILREMANYNGITVSGVIREALRIGIWYKQQEQIQRLPLDERKKLARDQKNISSQRHEINPGSFEESDC